jgi:ABC-type dipeptide/oligopeptide/nickel transport system permease subunit
MVLVLVGSMFDRSTSKYSFGECVTPMPHKARMVPRLWLSVCWLGAMLLLCLLAPWLPLHDPDAIDLARSHAPPGLEHWLGTDALGCDMLALQAHGGRTAVLVAL